MNLQSDFETRLAKIRTQMDQNGLDALIVYSSGMRNMLKPNYLMYLTEFNPLGSDAMLVIPRESDPVLFLAPGWDAQRAREESSIERVVGSRNPIEDGAEIVKSVRGRGKVGLVGKNLMPAAFLKALQVAVGSDLYPADEIVESVARTKSEREIGILRKASQIADAGLDAFVNAAKVGMTEYELSAEIDYAMRSCGAEDNFGMLASSNHNQAGHPPTERRLQPGDIVIAEITPGYKGYFVQLCRTVVMGQVSPLLQEKFDILRRAHMASIDACQLNAPASAVARAMNAVIAGEGYEMYCRPPYMRVRGHGFGYGSVAPGEMSEDNHTSIEAGMSFVIHPNQYIPETGYLMLGDMFLMTDHGVECLTKSEPKIFCKD